MTQPNTDTTAQNVSNVSLMLSKRQESVSRWQVKNLTNVVKNFKIVEFQDYIWNHHEKYIEIITNMPVIGSQIRDIGC